jgi:hypothetical protein
MTIEEAIKELNTLELPMKTAQNYDKHLAVRLGIEALKRIKEQKTQIPPWTGSLLPGETEDWFLRV